MGRSFLTVVVDESGATRVAQYGKGEFGGNARAAAAFVRQPLNVVLLAEKLKGVRWICEREKNEVVVAAGGRFGEWPTDEPTRLRVYERLPLIRPRIGSLVMACLCFEVSDEHLLLENSIDFVQDIFCDYVLLIDLQLHAFSVYAQHSLEIYEMRKLARVGQMRGDDRSLIAEFFYTLGTWNFDAVPTGKELDALIYPGRDGEH